MLPQLLHWHGHVHAPSLKGVPFPCTMMRITDHRKTARVCQAGPLQTESYMSNHKQDDDDDDDDDDFKQAFSNKQAPVTRDLQHRNVCLHDSAIIMCV